MYRLHLYLSEDLKYKIAARSKVTGKSKAEITREALEKGLDRINIEKSSSARALLNLVKMMEKIPTKGKVPKDAVKNMDYYTWGGSKRS